MERDSFIFYKSFYEAIADLPRDIRLEVLTAIIEYALFGRLPENLKPIAKGMFTLIKPNIDVNTTRFKNGKKGGRKSAASPASQPCPDETKKQTPPVGAAYTLSYEQEVEQLRTDEKCRSTICADFGISAEEYDKRLSRFLDRCNEDKARKGKEHHDSVEDCQSHLRYWMLKAYPLPQTNAEKKTDNNASPSPAPDYSFTGGFGGMDV